MSGEKDKLKTLKDLSSVSVHHTDYTKQKVFGIDGDNDLIFDKPPERRTENLNFVSHELLKQEGKKWIKHLRMYDLRYAHTYDEACAKIQWITHFFNITEEELITL